MIEKVLLRYLSANAGEPVYMEEPPDAPREFILIEKTGGGETNHVRNATVAIACRAESLLRAAEMNEEVKELMDGITVLPEISGCYLNSDYNYTDPERKRPRYQAVYTLFHY